MNQLRTKLQNALDATGYQGKIVEVFESHFNMPYEVGLVEMEDGTKATIKTKSTYRKTEKASHTRETEHRNLKMLEELNESKIPKALYYKDGTLLMTYIDGTVLSKTNLGIVEGEQFEEFGKAVRAINDLSTKQASHLPVIKDFAAFVSEKKKHLYNNRLILDYFSQDFYDKVMEQLFEKIVAKDAELVVVWNDGNTDNVLFKDDVLVGLIDFEEMVVAPRIVQFNALKGLSEEHWSHFAKGYGQAEFDAAFDRDQLKLLEVFSTLNALGLAHKDGAKEWFDKSLIKLEGLFIDLDMNVPIPKCA